MATVSRKRKASPIVEEAPVRVLPKRRTRPAFTSSCNGLAIPTAQPDEALSLRRFTAELLIHRPPVDPCPHGEYTELPPQFRQALVDRLRMAREGDPNEIGLEDPKPLPIFEPLNLKGRQPIASYDVPTRRSMRKTRSSDRTHTPHSTASDILGDAAEDATTDHIHRREEMAEKKLRNRDLEIAAHNLYRKQVLKDRLNYLSLNHLLPPTPASQSPPAYSRPAPEAVSENDQPLPGHGDNEATPPVERPNLRRPRRTPSSGSASTTIHAHSRRPTFRGSLLPLNVNMTKEEFRLPSTWLRKRK